MKEQKRTLMSLLLCLCLLVPLPTRAVAEGDADERMNDIAAAYQQALELSHLDSLKGYCGACVGYQLRVLGVNSYFVNVHGKDQFDVYRNLRFSSGGNPVTAYSAEEYSLRGALLAAAENGEQTVSYVLVGFQSGAWGSAADYGHTLLIHAIEDGTVYFVDSTPRAVAGVRYEEGEPVACSIDTFCETYAGYTFEGLIVFDPGQAWSGWNGRDNTYYIAGSQDWSDFIRRAAENPAIGAVMTRDVDVQGEALGVGSEAAPFAGSFDGGGHTLNIDISGAETAPFAWVDGCRIENLRLTGTVCGSGSASGLIGRSGAKPATVRGVWMDAEVSGGGCAAGMVGESGGIIRFDNCLVTGAVTASEGFAGAYAGWPSCSGLIFSSCLSAPRAVSPEPETPDETLSPMQFSNSYYAEDCPGAGPMGSGLDSDVLNSGRGARILNGGRTEAARGAWGQTLGTHALPVPGGEPVFRLRFLDTGGRELLTAYVNAGSCDLAALSNLGENMTYMPVGGEETRTAMMGEDTDIIVSDRG